MLRAGALAVESPPVEGADELAGVDRAAVADVRAEMRAERVLEVEVAGHVAPQHELTPEVVQRCDVARFEVFGIRDLEPAERDREREPATHADSSGSATK